MEKWNAQSWQVDAALFLVRINKNERGFGLLETLIALAILVPAFLGFLAMNAQLFKQTNNSTTQTSLDTVRRNIIALTINKAAWSSTINYGPNGMGCLANLSRDCRSRGTPTNRAFAIRDPAGAVYYDSRIPTTGVTPDGKICNSFSLTNPTNNCLFRFDLNWSAICQPTSCVNPMVVVRGTLRISQAAKGMVLNVNNFSIPTTMRPAQDP